MPSQHGCPAPPQPTHVLFWQMVLAWLHTPTQHAWPRPPHAPQEPGALQVVPVNGLQTSPGATQV
jgi:hypothetical protein